MGTEVSEIGEYALYIIYLLLVILIGFFIYVLQKKKLSVDISESDKKEHKKNSYKIDEKLLHNQHKHVINNEIKVVTKDKEKHSDSHKDILKRPIEQEVPKKTETKAFIYDKEIPAIEDVKPEFFKYFKGQKLLIVEDNKINQKILLNVLKNIDTPIDIANNGEEAIKKVVEENNSYDMILMDISMPIMDGINATKSIRSHAQYDKMPIVTVTAFTSGVEIKQMFEVGANAFLTKPLDIQKLFTVMLLFLDNTKSDIPIEDEFEILGINLAELKDTVHAKQSEIKEAIEEFVNKFSYLEEHMPIWIDNKNFGEVKNVLEELDMILDLIGAVKMQKFIESMQNAIDLQEDDVESYKILFIAQYKALLNTYKKYLNSI